MPIINLCSRAIDIQALVGNIGGYIGLFLGYSILQIPDFIVLIFYKVKMYISRSRKDTIKMDSNISFETRQEGSKKVNSNDDSLGVGRDVRSMIVKMSADIDEILTIVQKQEQRIESLEKNNNITPKI